MVEESDFRMNLPDKDCAYLELQLYQRKIFWGDTEDILYEEDLDDAGEEIAGVVEDEITGEEEAAWFEDAEEEVTGVAEEEVEEGYNDREKEEGWEPVGEPFRIAITQPEG